MTDLDFLGAIEDRPFSMFERALALLWWIGRDDPNKGLAAVDIGRLLEAHGYPKQNTSRLQSKLAADRRTSKAAGDAWKLHPKARQELNSQFEQLRTHRPVKASDSVLPRRLFYGTRGYIEKVVGQINTSYDAA